MNLCFNHAPPEVLQFIFQHESKPEPQKVRPLNSSQSEALSPDDVHRLLLYLDPDCTYHDWIQVGMALHAGGYPLGFWDDWSKISHKYKANECEAKWRGFNGCGGVTMATLVHMAKNAGWQPQSIDRPEKKLQIQKIEAPQLRLFHWRDLASLPKRKFLIKGLLDEGALSVVYGASNSGKTFFALHIACHIALGWSWQKRKVNAGSVVYIAGEGGLGISERLEAFRKHHRLDSYADIYLIPQAVMLAGDQNQADILINLLRGISDVKLIIVDTLARSMGNADENLAGDMGLFIQNCDKIRLQTGAHVIVIHHSGKDEQRGARGSSALKAAIDTEICISRTDGIIKAEVKKQRYRETGNSFHFELSTHTVGYDEDGDPVTSCILVDTQSHSKKISLNQQAKQAYETLSDLISKKGFEHIPANSTKKQKAVQIDDFKKHFSDAGISNAAKPCSIAKAFSRQIKCLKDKGLIAESNGFVWLMDRQDM